MTSSIPSYPLSDADIRDAEREEGQSDDPMSSPVSEVVQDTSDIPFSSKGKDSGSEDGEVPMPSNASDEQAAKVVTRLISRLAGLKTTKTSKSNPHWLRDLPAAASLFPKFSGEVTGKESLEREAELYRTAVKACLTSVKPPDGFQNHVAIALLSGVARDAVMRLGPDLCVQNGLPDFDAIMAVVSSLSAGTALSEVQQLLKLFNFCFMRTAVHAMKGSEVPEVNIVTHALRTEFSKFREAVLPDILKVLVFHRAMRAFPDLLEEVAYRFNPATNKREEVHDPDLLLETLNSFSPRFQNAVRAANKGKGPDNKKRKYEDSPQPDQPSGSAPLKTKHARPAKSNQNKPTNKPTKLLFNPFLVHKNECRSAKPKHSNFVPGVEGLVRADKVELSKEEKCWLCKKKGHQVLDCKEQESAFQNRTFCWHPRRQ